MDHVPPKSMAWAGNVLTDGWYLLPICKACNAALGDKPLVTPEARVEYMKKHYNSEAAKMVESLHYMRLTYRDKHELEVEKLRRKRTKQGVRGVQNDNLRGFKFAKK